MPFDFDQGDSGSGQGGSSGEGFNPGQLPEADEGYDYHPRLYWTPNALLKFKPLGFHTMSHDQYGQTVVLYVEDLEVAEGALYKRDFDASDGKPASEQKHAKFKAFAFSEILGMMSSHDGFSFEKLNGRERETAFGDKYFYDLQGASVVESEEPFETNAEGTVTIPYAQLYFDVNGADDDNPGPKSSSKRVIRLLAENGADDLNEENFDSVHGWANSDVQVAEDYAGRELLMWQNRRTVENEQGEEVTYSHLKIKDLSSGSMLEVRGATDATETTPDSAEDESTAESDSSSTGDDAPWGDEDDESAEASDDSTELTFTDEEEESLEWIAERYPGKDDDWLYDTVSSAMERGGVFNDGRDMETVAEAVKERAAAPEA